MAYLNEVVNLPITCPDCKAEMKIQTPSYVLVEGSKKQMRGKKVNGYMCPSCGLVRLYADKDPNPRLQDFEFPK